jgi:hypothetical protein
MGNWRLAALWSRRMRLPVSGRVSCLPYRSFRARQMLTTFSSLCTEVYAKPQLYRALFASPRRLVGSSAGWCATVRRRFAGGSLAAAGARSPLSVAGLGGVSRDRAVRRSLVVPAAGRRLDRHRQVYISLKLQLHQWPGTRLRELGMVATPS